MTRTRGNPEEILNKVIIVGVTPAMHAEAQQLARAEGRSVANLLRHLLQQKLERTARRRS